MFAFKMGPPYIKKNVFEYRFAYNYINCVNYTSCGRRLQLPDSISSYFPLLIKEDLRGYQRQVLILIAVLQSEREMEPGLRYVNNIKSTQT